MRAGVPARAAAVPRERRHDPDGLRRPGRGGVPEREGRADQAVHREQQAHGDEAGVRLPWSRLRFSFSFFFLACPIL